MYLNRSPLSRFTVSQVILAVIVTFVAISALIGTVSMATRRFDERSAAAGTRLRCDTARGACVVDAHGPYLSLSECSADCRINCAGTNCPNGFQPNSCDCNPYCAAGRCSGSQRCEPTAGGGQCHDQSICTPGEWGSPSCGGQGCSAENSPQCNATGTGWNCVWNPSLCAGNTANQNPTPTPPTGVGGTEPLCTSPGQYSCAGNTSKYCINPAQGFSTLDCGEQACVEDSRRCIDPNLVCRAVGTYCDTAGTTWRSCTAQGDVPVVENCESWEQCVPDQRKCIPKTCTTVGYSCSNNQTSIACATIGETADVRVCPSGTQCVSNAVRCFQPDTQVNPIEPYCKSECLGECRVLDKSGGLCAYKELAGGESCKAKDGCRCASGRDQGTTKTVDQRCRNDWQPIIGGQTCHEEDGCVCTSGQNQGMTRTQGQTCLPDREYCRAECAYGCREESVTGGICLPQALLEGEKCTFQYGCRCNIGTSNISLSTGGVCQQDIPRLVFRCETSVCQVGCYDTATRDNDCLPFCEASLNDPRKCAYGCIPTTTGGNCREASLQIATATRTTCDEEQCPYGCDSEEPSRCRSVCEVSCEFGCEPSPTGGSCKSPPSYLCDLNVCPYGCLTGQTEDNQCNVGVLVEGQGLVIDEEEALEGYCQAWQSAGSKPTYKPIGVCETQDRVIRICRRGVNATYWENANQNECVATDSLTQLRSFCSRELRESCRDAEGTCLEDVNGGKCVSPEIRIANETVTIVNETMQTGPEVALISLPIHGECEENERPFSAIGCGPASVCNIMGNCTSEQLAILAQQYTYGCHGTRMNENISILESYGYHPYQLFYSESVRGNPDQDLADIRASLEAGNQIMALVNINGYVHHYVAITGFNEDGNMIFVDPYYTYDQIISLEILGAISVPPN